jgi:Protein of unknown function (DUF3306)
MTSSENFVLRWARLKNETDTGLKTEAVGPEPQQQHVASVDTETPSLRQKDEAAEEPFDPASLPSIEMITVDTDIRGFLQSRVPAALTRAALRRAWASDPAIRDFIGIAENQWDFNDPTAMPGFGPMLETDKLPALLARALGGYDKLADIIPEIPTVVENALQVGTGSAPTDPDRSLQQMPGRSPSSVGICDLLDEGRENTATGNERFEEEGGSSRSHRSQGSALPR